MSPRPQISAAVEGPVDEAVVEKLVHLAGGETSRVFGRQGKQFLRQRIAGYNKAARISPWIVLADFDGDDGCPAAHRKRWLTDTAPLLCFRLAVHEVESWLLADQVGLARFLMVPDTRFPDTPDRIPDPKVFLVNLARHSRSRRIVSEIVPRPSSGRSIGTGYTSRVIEFIRDEWDPVKAEQRSPSLRQCRRRIRELISKVILDSGLPAIEPRP